MRVFRGFDELPSFGNAVVTVGSFDGLHSGHLQLLERCRELAKSSDAESVVLTFETHPRVVLRRAEGLRLLTTLEEKSILLEQLGIDNLIVIPFDRDFSRLTHEAFIRNYLIEKVGAKTLVVGYNHHFGRDSEGSYNSVVKLGKDYNIEISKVDEWRDAEGNNVSSTVVRTLLSRGEADRAISLLKRPYLIMAQIDGDGRVWCPDALKLIPAEGRYRALVDGVERVVVVDSQGIMWCTDAIQRAKIEILGEAKTL